MHLACILCGTFALFNISALQRNVNLVISYFASNLHCCVFNRDSFAQRPQSETFKEVYILRFFILGKIIKIKSYHVVILEKKTQKTCILHHNVP